MEVYFSVPIQAQGFVDHAGHLVALLQGFPQDLGRPPFLGCGFTSSMFSMAAKCLLSHWSQATGWKKGGKALIWKNSGPPHVTLSLMSC